MEPRDARISPERVARAAKRCGDYALQVKGNQKGVLRQCEELSRIRPLVDSSKKRADPFDPDFDKFHQIAIDELNAFNYEEYKANGFKVKHLGDCHCELYDRPEGFSSVPLMCKR